MAELVDLDIIIGGHSHSLLWSEGGNLMDDFDSKKVVGPYPTWMTNNQNRPIPICHAFEYG